MKQRNTCLPTGLVTPRMTLASAVNGRDGSQLLAAGTLLDTDMLERLIRRGVETLWISIADERDQTRIDFELRSAEERIAAIFQTPGSAAREALRVAVSNYRREALK